MARRRAAKAKAAPAPLPASHDGSPRRPRRTPPGSLGICVLGGILGAFLAVAGEALLWSLMEGRDPAAAASRVIRSWASHPVLLASGFGAGVIATGLLVGNHLVRNVLGLVRRGLQAALGALLGAFGATLAYAVIWASNGGDLALLVPWLAEAWNDPADPYPVFLAAGAMAGVLGSFFAMGKGAFKSASRLLTGALVGGLAGLVLYSFAYVLVYYPEAPQGSEYILRFAEAIHSLTPSEFISVGIAAAAGALLSGYSWRLYGILTFLSLLFVVLGYVLHTVAVTLPTVPPEERLLSRFLFVAELTSLLMVLLYSFYTIDVASRKKWRRTTEEATFSPFHLPKVAIQVPCYNEPAELVTGTLDRLRQLDYPADRFVIMVADDSTRPESSEPIREYCARHKLTYVHRTDRTGYKAGALNVLLRHTPEDVELIAVVDADYHVEPAFLRETVGYFVDNDLGWLQTPQDYRNRHQSFLTEQYYLADAYFYRTILPSRNEENSIIFCGTMGMLRKRALVEAGGWNEKCITEDAELSVRLLNAGWRSLYINKTYGRGLIPATFEGYKKQHYRWAFGGGRILRTHGLRLLFGRFTFRQRMDFMLGALNWFEGSFLLVLSLFVLSVGIADATGSQIVTHHAQEILLVGLVPLLLLLDGLTRSHLVLRRTIHLGFGGTLRMLGMWWSVKFSNTRAALKGLLGFSMAFLRTKKSSDPRLTKGASMRRALQLTPFESFMAMALMGTSLAVAVHMVLAGTATAGAFTARVFLIFWLLYYGFLFAAAPIYAYKSFVTLRPDSDPQPAASARPDDIAKEVNA